MEERQSAYWITFRAITVTMRGPLGEGEWARCDGGTGEHVNEAFDLFSDLRNGRSAHFIKRY